MNAPSTKGYGGYSHGPVNFGHEENRDGYSTKVTGMDTSPIGNRCVNTNMVTRWVHYEGKREGYTANVPGMDTPPR